MAEDPRDIVIFERTTPVPAEGETPEATFPKYPRLPVSKEIALLEVRGAFYSNWTTVRVEQKVTEAFPTFQFECTEQVDVPLNIEGAQFIPGDTVRVLLGGAPALFGYITERHVGYDKGQHGVRLIGTGKTVDLVTSSVPLDKLNGHDGKSVEQLARDISAHLGIDVHTRGAVDGKPFEKIAIQPGETPMQAIERYAKMRAIVIGSEAQGALLLIGQHPATTLGWLAEGINILRANCVIRDLQIYKKIFATGQNGGSDSSNGDPANKQVVEKDGTSTRNRHIVVVADVADKMHGIERRAEMEKIFTEGGYVEAHITVQGWFKDANRSDDLWRAGEYYLVQSPSLLLNQEVLGCAACTYEQSDAGTTTTMRMVLPIHMNGLRSMREAAVIFEAKMREQERLDREQAAADRKTAEGE